MTRISTITNTFYNNPKGVIVSKLPYDLYELKGNLKFYKFDIFDVVEIDYTSDFILIIEFSHNKGRASFIIDDPTTYVAYFEAAGLKGKKFLFDTSNRIPISTVDFEEYEKVPNIENANYLLLANSYNKDTYITGEKSIIVFTTTMITESIDKCLLSLANNSKLIYQPKRFELYGCAVSAIVSGLLGGVNFEEIKQHSEVVDPTYKFVTNVSKMQFGLSKPSIKVDKLKKIIGNANSEVTSKKDLDLKNNVSKGSIQLSTLVESGLDKFLKFIDNQNLVINVNIDTMTNVIRRAYISQGVMFIDPYSLVNLSYIREVLDSDNIELYLL
jgi:hypothetical protein